MTVNRFNFTVRTAAPTGIASTGTTSSSVSLSWSPITYATGYRVYRGGVLVGSPTGTAYTDSGLTPSTQYSYRVSAMSAGGESAQSAAVNFTTAASTVTPLFLDGFDYVVERDVLNEPTVWSSRGWGPSVKAMNVTNQNGGRGWIYTTAASPTGAGRSLVLESRPDLAPSFAGERQTDYYLTYGNAALGNLNTIPGDVWLQYWTYCTPGSRWFGESKHIYPTFATSHQTSTLHWMILQGASGFAQVGGYPPLANGARRMCLQTSDAVNPGADVGAGLAQWKLFQNLDQSGFLAGTWYQVKHHINTSGAQGSWEMWRRAYGVSTWTKLAEWIGGVTMVPHWQTGVPTLFNWLIGSSSGATPSGHTAFKMPTVVVCPDGDPYSSFEYIDDFGIYASDPG